MVDIFSSHAFGVGMTPVSGYGITHDKFDITYMMTMTMTVTIYFHIFFQFMSLYDVDMI